MNNEMAVDLVSEFVAAVRQLGHLMDTSPYSQDHPQAPQIRSQINDCIALVEEIAGEVNLVDVDRLRDWNYQGHRGRAVAAGEEIIGILKNAERRQLIMGDAGPKLSATALHRWVWEEAAPRWDAGFYRDAVQAAATRIVDTELPRKLGVQPSKTPADLFAAFAPDRAVGPTLRFPGLEKDDVRYASIHRGTMLVGQGVILSIRNPRTHRLEVGEQQHALEELATLSQLARWIDDADLAEPAP